MKNLNVFEIFKSSQFAFIKGNRPTDEKAIKAKKDSLAEYGMLCPITAVNGKAIIASGGRLTACLLYTSPRPRDSRASRITYKK